jgi:cell division protein FtsL
MKTGETQEREGMKKLCKAALRADRHSARSKRAFMPFSLRIADNDLMRCHQVAVSMTAALLFSQQAVVRAAEPQSRTATQQERVIKTNQEWQRLRTSATSAGDFSALAKWADVQARLSQKKATDSEEQLRRPYPSNFARNQILTNTVRHYKKKTEYWSNLSSFYTTKAQSVTIAGDEQ